MTNSSVGFPQFYQIQQILDRFLEIVSGHLFESDFRPCFKMFLDGPLGYALTDRLFLNFLSANNH